jgi:ParB family chromosome partitioning protein
VADAELVDAALELGQQLVVNRLLDEQTRAGTAHLALVEEDGVDEALAGGVEVGVVEDDHGRLAAELEAELLAGAGDAAAQHAADRRRAGERHLVDVGVVGEVGADGARARDDVEDARRQAGLGADLGEEQRREARVAGRLDDDGVAHGERRADLPGEQHERKVPRHNLADDAERLPLGQLVLHQLRPAGVVVEVARDERNVRVARLAQRLAVVERLDAREQAVVLLHVPRNAVEVLGALVRRQRRPRAKGGTRRLHGDVDVGRFALNRLAQSLAVG